MKLKLCNVLRFHFLSLVIRFPLIKYGYYPAQICSTFYNRWIVSRCLFSYFTWSPMDELINQIFEYSHNIFIYKHYTVQPWFWSCCNHIFNTLAMFQITDIGRRAVTISELSWVYLLMWRTDCVSPLHSLQFLSDACTYMCYIQIIQVSVWFIYMNIVFCMCANYIICL